MSVSVNDAAVAAVLGPDLEGVSVEGHTFHIGRVGVTRAGDHSALVAGSIKYVGSNQLDADIQYFYSMRIAGDNIVDFKVTAEQGSVLDLIEIAGSIVNKSTGNKINADDLAKLQQGIRNLVESNVAKEVALLLISYIAKLVRLRSEANFADTRKYKITVKTGSDEDAGTNANVYIKLIGTRGSVAGDTDKRLLGSGLMDDFEAGSELDYDIEVDGEGSLERIRVGHDNANDKPGWLLEYVTVQVDGEPMRWFMWNKWLASDAPGDIETDDLLPTEKAEIVEYDIFIQTSRKDSAGTDANVWIELLGENGSTGRNILAQDATNNFEKGKLDHFAITATDVGNLRQIMIGHDNAGDKAGWHLAWIKVRRHGDQAMELQWNRWLAVDELNDPLVRIDHQGVRTVKLDLTPASSFP